MILRYKEDVHGVRAIEQKGERVVYVKIPSRDKSLVRNPIACKYQYVFTPSW